MIATFVLPALVAAIVALLTQIAPITNAFSVGTSAISTTEKDKPQVAAVKADIAKREHQAVSSARSRLEKAFGALKADVARWKARHKRPPPPTDNRDLPL